MEARDNVKRLTNTLVETAACPPGRSNVIVWDEKVKGLDHPHRAIFVDQHQNRRSWFRPFAPADATKEDFHG